MKRLIDADDLKRALVTNGFRNDFDMMMTIETINNAPTIDAVPVSFIQELIKQDNQFIEAYGGIQECEVIVDGLIERVVNYEALIEKWREKNGTDVD